VQLSVRKPHQQMRVLSDHNLSSAMAFLVSLCWILLSFFLLSFAFCSPIVRRHVDLYMTLRSRADWEAGLKCEVCSWAAEGMRRCWRLFADRAAMIGVLVLETSV
jgi:hypothetical protein